jgi:outer membrane protein TolC
MSTHARARKGWGPLAAATVFAATGGLVLLSGAPRATGQGPARESESVPLIRLSLGQPEPPAENILPPPRRELPASVAAFAWAQRAEPMSLPVAMRLAELNNLDIALARAALLQARAAQQRVEVAWLPTFNLGSTWSHHEGQIQKTEGLIERLNKNALFVGGGPSIIYPLADVLFAPAVSRALTAASGAAAQRVNNDTLLVVADAYFNLVLARRRLARIEETLEILTSEQKSPLRDNGPGLLPLVKSVVAAGGLAARPAELERVRVEVLRRQEEKSLIVEEFLLAAAELARLLRLDPQVPLWPLEDFRKPIPVPGDNWVSVPLEELVRTALNNRPELAENQALVQAAVDRVRNARWRPLLPNALLTYNFGEFGGGPDSTSELSGDFRHFNTRTDLDVSLIWRFQNLGFGNITEVRELKSVTLQASLRLAQAQDRVVAQVVRARELVDGGRERLDITRSSLFDNQGAPKGPVFRSLLLNFRLIRNEPTARTLEVLDSIRSLSDALESYGQALTSYERARFRLLVALGFPPERLFELPPDTPPLQAPVAPARP